MTMFGACANKLASRAKMEEERRKLRQKRNKDQTFGYSERKVESKYLISQQFNFLVLVPQFLLHFTLGSMKYSVNFPINVFFPSFMLFSFIPLLTNI